MPLDILELAKNEATDTITVAEGFDVTVTYRPFVVTQKWQVDLTELQAEGQAAAADGDVEKAEEIRDRVTEKFGELLLEWDLTAGGEPVGIDNDGFNLIPLRLLNTIMRKIMETATGAAEAQATKKS